MESHAGIAATARARDGRAAWYHLAPWMSPAPSSRLRPPSCSLDGIEALGRLRTLILFDVGGEDLSPLAGLAGLARLRLASLRVADASLRALHGLLGLRDVFVADMFPPEEMRALAAALPEARGEWLDTYRRDPDGPSELRRRAALRRLPGR